MSPDLKKIYEDNLENFISKCYEDPELEVLALHAVILSKPKRNRASEEELAEAFNLLWDWDAEGVHYNPKRAIKIYIYQKEALR